MIKNMKVGYKISLAIFISAIIFGIGINFVRAEDLPLIDITAPVITLLGDATITINQGETYIDAGATASDDLDGNITTNIVINNLVNKDVAGNYTVTYSVSDAAGNNAAPVIRNVIVNNSPVVPDETLIIRNNENIIWQGSISLPEAGNISLNDSTGVAHNINSQSVLALLYSASQSSHAFSISNLVYYDSFNSFYLKCITSSDGVELCDNWQYSVGNSTPSQSIDSTILSGNQNIGIYFGTPHQLKIESASIIVGTPFSIKAEKYNYSDNTWSPLVAVSVGITLPNPVDPWTPIVVATKPVDSLGNVSFTLNEVNNFSVGIVEDYYFPVYQLSSYINSTGGVEKIPENNKKVFDVTKAINFLKKNQSADGSFLDTGLYTDWAGIAYSAGQVNDEAKDLIIKYLIETSKVSMNLTDNERRVMTLLSLGQNPYDFNKTNYIESIIQKFDGQQFGDTNLITDDIFAIMPLLSSGYTKDDDLIQKDVSYILSEQATDGSWNNSVDVTSATIQALSLIKSKTTDLAINQAELYILSKQNNDGGFDSVYSTSWAELARVVLNKPWEKNKNTPLDYLTTQQSSDGGLLVPDETIANRIWATSYAAVAALGKSWNSLFVPVQKPVVNNLIENHLPAGRQADSPEKSEGTDKIKVSKSFEKTNETQIKKLEKPSPKLVVQKPVVEKVVENDNQLIAEPAKTQENPFKKNLPLIAVSFIIIGGFVVYRFWV